jgi:hypothetical protein
MRPSAPSNGKTSLPGAKFKSANHAAAPCIIETDTLQQWTNVDI